MPERPAIAGPTPDDIVAASASGERLPEGVSLRPATESDTGGVEKLTSLLFAAYGSYERYLLEWMRRDDVRTVVARCGSTLCGYAMIRFHDQPRSAELIAIAVSPAQQSRGIGGALLACSFSMARDYVGASGNGELWLSVADCNARAQRFFASRGFRLRREVGVYPAGQRALSMSKALGTSTPSKGDET